MKSRLWGNLTSEELVKKEKFLKMTVYMLGGALVLLFVLTIYNTTQKGFSALNVVPLGLLPMLILNINNLNEIRKELKSRK